MCCEKQTARSNGEQKLKHCNLQSHDIPRRKGQSRCHGCCKIFRGSCPWHDAYAHSCVLPTAWCGSAAGGDAFRTGRQPLCHNQLCSASCRASTGSVESATLAHGDVHWDLLVSPTTKHYSLWLDHIISRALEICWFKKPRQIHDTQKLWNLTSHLFFVQISTNLLGKTTVPTTKQQGARRTSWPSRPSRCRWRASPTNRSRADPAILRSVSCQRMTFFVGENWLMVKDVCWSTFKEMFERIPCPNGWGWFFLLFSSK